MPDKNLLTMLCLRKKTSPFLYLW